MALYLIRSMNESSPGIWPYWSSKQGWVADKTMATRYTENQKKATEERDDRPMPPGGGWEKIPTTPANFRAEYMLLIYADLQRDPMGYNFDLDDVPREVDTMLLLIREGRTSLGKGQCEVVKSLASAMGITPKPDPIRSFLNS